VQDHAQRVAQDLLVDGAGVVVAGEVAGRAAAGAAAGEPPGGQLGRFRACGPSGLDGVGAQRVVHGVHDVGRHRRDPPGVGRVGAAARHEVERWMVRPGHQQHQRHAEQHRTPHPDPQRLPQSARQRLERLHRPTAHHTAATGRGSGRGSGTAARRRVLRAGKRAPVGTAGERLRR
jgi:hypothetical protein